MVDEGVLDFYDAKGAVEAVLEQLGVEGVFEPSDAPMFHPGRCARILAGGVELGLVGEVHPETLERFDLDPRPVALFELRLQSLFQCLSDTSRRVQSLARYPAATRDLALVVPSDVAAGQVREALLRHRLVDRAELFDVYTGDRIPAGTKSLAFHLFFQSDQWTLTAEDVERSLQGLLRTLENQFGARLRA